MFQKKQLHTAILAALAVSGSTAATAEIEEIVVTATKRSASTQDVPVAVTALGEQTLKDFGISNFADYLINLPRRHCWRQRPRTKHRLYSRRRLDHAKPDNSGCCGSSTQRRALP